MWRLLKLFSHTLPSHTMFVEQGFQQKPFSIPLAWDGDRALQSLIRRLLPSDVLQDVEPDLRGM